MEPLEAPKASPETLLSIVQQNQAGKVALPEFQRNFVSDRKRITTMLGSILESYLTATFLMLKRLTGGPNLVPHELCKCKNRPAHNFRATSRITVGELAGASSRLNHNIPQNRKIPLPFNAGLPTRLVVPEFVETGSLTCRQSRHESNAVAQFA